MGKMNDKIKTDRNKRAEFFKAHKSEQEAAIKPEAVKKTRKRRTKKTEE